MTITLLLIGGLVLLLLGGEILVRGASLIAFRFGVSPLMIGLTVVGFGTSTPELMTSLQAALAGSPGIAVGNIVGSNIANVLLILGIAALLSPISAPARTVVRDGGLMVGAALALFGLGWFGGLGRIDGAILLAGLAGYLILLWSQERRHPPEKVEGIAADAPTPGGLAVAKEVALLVGGIAGVVLGGKLLVEGAIGLAEAAGVPDTIIGLTIVAIGTSLPELATSVIAAMRNQSDIAYGNIVGSNIFNALGIAGTTALVVPISVPAEILAFDLPVMIGISLLMAVFAATGNRITRLEGGVLLAGYAVYIGFIVV